MDEDGCAEPRAEEGRGVVAPREVWKLSSGAMRGLATCTSITMGGLAGAPPAPLLNESFENELGEVTGVCRV